jgi:nondiscriminating glutamyl-tRNA synthetase
MTKVRVRFAPSPTGMMHLGNVRTALINFLFARQKEGVFVLRIEDTDAQRMLDPEAKKILEDLTWLGFSYDEGPIVGGQHAPYFQSERISLYEQKRILFEQKNLIYRCFCTEEELTKKRDRQIALKLPPRYDRTCLALSPQEVTKLIENNTPFIWRFKLDHSKSVSINDLAHGTTTFELKNFSDFTIARQDGSFTFIFANFVDDWMMNISHVFRGEDHLSNTANQAALFEALSLPLPTYWHMPILCNTEGKKLSKRDFGFSLRDLKDAGFLPEAIANYVGTIGGSFKTEIMSLEELTHAFNFDAISSAGRITYDLEKLKWFNKSWINRYDAQKLTNLCRPILENAYPSDCYSTRNVTDQKLTELLQIIKPELTTLNDCVDILKFYFEEPSVTKTDIAAFIPATSHYLIKTIINDSFESLDNPLEFATRTKNAAKEKQLPLKELFWFLRLAIIGKVHGPGIHELIEMIGEHEARQRIDNALNLL